MVGRNGKGGGTCSAPPPLIILEQGFWFGGDMANDRMDLFCGVDNWTFRVFELPGRMVGQSSKKAKRKGVKNEKAVCCFRACNAVSAGHRSFCSGTRENVANSIWKAYYHWPRPPNHCRSGSYQRWLFLVSRFAAVGCLIFRRKILPGVPRGTFGQKCGRGCHG